jgi:regulator of protease activity HflC (stomatin/prohibitin superfamily)
VEYVVPVLVAALVVATVVVVVRQVKVVTIRDWERGLRLERGRLAGVVDPGVHVTFGPVSQVLPIDLRPVSTPVDGQEVLTADGVAAKVSLVARYVVGDPVAAITRDSAYQRTVHLWLQVALRDAIGRRSLEQALADRSAMGQEIKDAASVRASEIGVDLLEVQVRDVMLPGELKRGYAAVVAARKEGEAALERARAETATLRSLANAGRAVADNPGLLQLRILQQLGASSGNTIVFGASEAGLVPHRGGPGPEDPDPGAGPAAASRAAGRSRPAAVSRPAAASRPAGTPARRGRPASGA